MRVVLGSVESHLEVVFVVCEQTGDNGGGREEG